MNIQAYINFSEAYVSLKDMKFPMKTSYKLSKLAANAAHEIEFYRTKMGQIIQTYCVKDENGQPLLDEAKNGYQIIAEKREECDAALNELISLEVEDSKIRFSIEDFGSEDIEPAILQNLIPFIED